jgi:hypothetical protein
MDSMNEYKLSQNLDNIYPQSDVDTVISDVESSVSVASRQTIGKVDVSDPRLSTTKETIINYLKDFNNAYSVSQIVKVSNTCTITTNSNNQLNGIRTTKSISSGSGYVDGTYYDIPLCPTSGVNGENATANVTVDGGQVTEVSISNPGSGYVVDNQLIIKGIPGSISETRCSVASLLPENIGAVQILGSIYQENNGVFRITSSTKNTVSYTNSSGRTETNSTAAAIICIPVYAISNVAYDQTKNQTTITTTSTQPHPFLIGNTVFFDGAFGKFTVSDVTSNRIFKVIGDATGATAVYSSGLTSQPKDTNSSNENANSRQFTIVDGFVSRITQSGGITNLSSNVDVNPAIGLNKGDFIQIEDEIMLVTQTGGSTINVIRGVLGTNASSHVNGSAIRRIKINAIELRRNSILRASGHTFEYTGFGPGNYSTGMPTNQDRVLTNDQVLISQSLPTHGGLVVYTGMNSNGEFFIGRKKYDATTGEEISLTPTVESETSFIDNLTVNTITVNNKLDASTAFAKIKELTVGIATVTDKLVVSGISTFKSGMEVTGISTFNSGMEVTGISTFNSGMEVTGASTFNSNVTVTAPATISGYGTIPIGGIIMWSGSIASIATNLPNWKLCDGNNGTPNLTDKFIIGASIDDGEAKTTVTGANTKTGGTKDAVVVDHTHTLGPLTFKRGRDGETQTEPHWGGGDRGDGSTPGADIATTSGASNGESGTNKNLPPYYALAFIMRVS